MLRTPYPAPKTADPSGTPTSARSRQRVFAGRSRRLSWVVLLGLGVYPLLGCVGVETLLDGARQGSPEARRRAILDLGSRLSSARPSDPEAVDTRDRINAFILRRFPGKDNPSEIDRQEEEQDTVALTNLISIAVQGELPCAGTIAARGTRNPESTVRLVAVQALRDVAPAERQEILTDLLLRDSDLLVRIEAAKSMARVGDASWVKPLALVIVNPAEDGNLRYQCHRAGLVLLGADFSYLPARWREWLDDHP
ncbi:MAG: HEAT repeat domain-containing protein [Planctomycetota bacterium]